MLGPEFFVPLVNDIEQPDISGNSENICCICCTITSDIFPSQICNLSSTVDLIRSEKLSSKVLRLLYTSKDFCVLSPSKDILTASPVSLSELKITYAFHSSLKCPGFTYVTSFYFLCHYFVSVLHFSCNILSGTFGSSITHHHYTSYITTSKMHNGFLAMLHGLWVLVPQLELNPGRWQWQRAVPSHWTAREILKMHNELPHSSSSKNGSELLHRFRLTFLQMAEGVMIMVISCCMKKAGLDFTWFRKYLGVPWAAVLWPRRLPLLSGEHLVSEKDRAQASSLL